MSKKKSKKIRKEQAQELSSAESEHPELAAEKTAAIASYIKDPDYALYDAGITIDDVSPDYVVVGETNTYGYEHILRAMNLVNKGAKLIATNTDITGPIEGGIAPACRAFVAPIEATTGKQAYYVGKPNPLMMRTGLRILGVHSNEAVMIGDRMDTDVIAGIETGLDTVLVLSGVSTRETVDKFPYRPRLILNGVGDIPVLEK